jgi:hypothetical protein
MSDSGVTLPRITQNAQLVYHSMSGTKTAVKPIIHSSVSLLELEFHNVKLTEGSTLEGSMKGNRAAPVSYTHLTLPTSDLV